MSSPTQSVKQTDWQAELRAFSKEAAEDAKALGHLHEGGAVGTGQRAGEGISAGKGRSKALPHSPHTQVCVCVSVWVCWYVCGYVGVGVGVGMLVWVWCGLGVGVGVDADVGCEGVGVWGWVRMRASCACVRRCACTCRIFI